MGQGRYVTGMVQLLFSISLVSFLISISSWVCFGFQTLRFCVTTLPIQLITHSINRNCIFLICNGLLVFIAKTSGLNHGPNPSVSLQDSCSLLLASGEFKTTKHIEHEKDGKEEDDEEGNYGMLEKSKTSTPPEVDKEVVMVHGDGSSFKRWIFDNVKGENPVMGENEGDEDIKELSMDDVNKRFDEFIRKMKEEIRLEASNHIQLNLY